MILFAIFLKIIFDFTAYGNQSQTVENSISVMTYNVESLFDNIPNESNEDYTFIPYKLKSNAEHRNKCKALGNYHWQKECLYLNWDQSALKSKLEKIAQIIQKYDNFKGPDIVILTEVENLTILKSLNQSLKIPYSSTYLIEDSDPRGINVGILSRFDQKTSPRLVPEKIKSKSKYIRRFLRVELSIRNNLNLTVFGIHLPSNHNPNSMREKSIQELNNLVKQEPDTNLIIAAGDFNISSSDDSYFYRSMLAPLWHVSHLAGCQTCLGTYYYSKDKNWSFFDAILLYKNNKAKFIEDSIEIWQPFDFQRTDSNKPKRIVQRGRDVDGLSDHFPMVAKIQIIDTSDNKKQN